MKYYALAFSSFLLTTSPAYSTSNESFRFHLALRPASAPEITYSSTTLPDLTIEYAQLKTYQMDNAAYLSKIDEDLSLFTCGNNPTETFQWIIEYKKTEKPIGVVGLYNIDKKNGSATLAFFLEKEYRDQPLISGIMHSVLWFSYTQINLNRVDFYLYPDKIGFTETTMACKELGFTKVGEWPEYIYHNGCYHNFILYSLLQQKIQKTLS